MKSYKEDFPLLRNSSIAYLDNAATAQRPEAVLKAERAVLCSGGRENIL